MKLSTFKTYSLTLPDGSLFPINRPQVMGIMNMTEDSFYAGSCVFDKHEVAEMTRSMANNGVDIIDVGACSTRPGAQVVDADNEIMRLRKALPVVKKVLTEFNHRILLSVDTFRSDIARMVVEEFGADIVNDISGGQYDKQLWSVIRELRVPYVLMHSRGTPDTMQSTTDYDIEGGIVAAVLEDLARKTDQLYQMGVNDVIIDPGFGFAKTLQQNYELFLDLEILQSINAPVLVGISRKSMIYRQLEATPSDVLPATTALNTLALEKGAHILRVHDVKAARQAIEMIEKLRSTASSINTISTFRNL